MTLDVCDPQITEIVLFGCGAMAVEATLYIDEMARHGAMANERLAITDIVSTNFDRLRDIEGILGRKPATHSDIKTCESFTSKNSVVAIGSGTAIYRIREYIKSYGGSFISVVHPSAWIAPTAEIGSGSIISPYCFVGPYSKIGEGSILNVRTTVGHDVEIGDCVVLSPHSDINGSAKIGKGCFIGAGVTVDPCVNIADFCKISSGITVRKNVGAGSMVIDNNKQKQIKMFSEINGENLFMVS